MDTRNVEGGNTPTSQSGQGVNTSTTNVSTTGEQGNSQSNQQLVVAVATTKTITATSDGQEPQTSQAEEEVNDLSKLVHQTDKDLPASAAPSSAGDRPASRVINVETDLRKTLDQMANMSLDDALEERRQNQPNREENVDNSDKNNLEKGPLDGQDKGNISGKYI